MKKVFYGLTICVVLFATYLVLRPTPVRVESVVLKLGEFDETLLIEGKIRSRDKITVYATATGNLEQIQLRQGDTVTKGQMIVKLNWDRVSIVRSPIDGVVSKVFRESAGPIVRGEPILEVSSLSQLEVVTDLLTTEAVRLSPNGVAKIQNWGGQGELSAQITQISRAGTVKTSALGVEEERTQVVLAFKPGSMVEKNKFGDNYHVDVAFLISHETNVLTVPLGALFKNREQWAVYVVKDRRAHLRAVKISKKNDQQALVTDGLNEGETIILFPGDKIREGTKVETFQ